MCHKETKIEERPDCEADIRGPGTKIAASRTKQPATMSSNECRRLRIATHLVAVLPAHSNEWTHPAGAPAHRQLSN
jgi:hypothetical protein